MRLSRNGENRPYRPFIDVLFTTAAWVYSRRVIGVLLLHGREDGLPGLHAVCQAGGRTITHHNNQMAEPPKHPNTGERLSEDYLELNKLAQRP